MAPNIGKSSMKHNGGCFTPTPAYSPVTLQELQANAESGVLFAPRQQGIQLKRRNQILRNAPLCRQFSHEDQYLSVNNISNNSEAYNRHLEATYERGIQVISAGKTLDEKTLDWLHTLSKHCSTILLKKRKQAAESKVAKLHDEFQAWFEARMTAEFEDGELRQAGFNEGKARFCATRRKRTKVELAKFEEENREDLDTLLESRDLRDDESRSDGEEREPNNSLDTPTDVQAAAAQSAASPSSAPLSSAPLKSSSSVEGQSFASLDDFLAYITATEQAELDREVESDAQRLVVLQHKWQSKLDACGEALSQYDRFAGIFLPLAHKLAAQFKVKVDAEPLTVGRHRKHTWNGLVNPFHIQTMLKVGVEEHGLRRTGADLVLAKAHCAKGSPADHSVEFKGRIVADHCMKIREMVDALLPKPKERKVGEEENGKRRKRILEEFERVRKKRKKE